MLKGEPARGGQPYQKESTRTTKEQVETTPTLADLGVTKKEASQAEMLASL